MRSQRVSNCTVSVGTESVIIADSVRSQRYVANILGTEVAEGGSKRIYLDRRVHDLSMVFDQWEASGAISTILTETKKP
ncbi:MAG: hypothetical protein LW865_01960 [Betaproteobacteria bacterium]|jgi:hypothetical protein|nr:hypothetical protein [Betaproteobacteria bacterium]